MFPLPFVAETLPSPCVSTAFVTKSPPFLGVWAGLMSADNIHKMQAKFQHAGVNLNQAFLAFDENNDGQISTAEFRRGIRALVRSQRDGARR